MKRGRKPRVFADALRDLAVQGVSREEAAKAIGVSYSAISYAAKRFGVVFARKVISLPWADELNACQQRGESVSEAARKIGIKYWQAYVTARRMGLKFRDTRRDKRAAPDKRSAEMARLYRSGVTLAAIGQQYGVTRERVRQIITRHHGLNWKKGGIHAQAERRSAETTSKRDVAALDRHGCTWAQLKGLRLIGKQMCLNGTTYNRTPIGAFVSQKKNAEIRGIPWELKLWEWWGIWQASGHWEQRGRGDGYVMARVGDSGPYSATNVYITTAAGNIRDSALIRGLNVTDLPLGVRKSKRGRFVAQRSINGEKLNLGTFDTPEEAHAAYLAAAPSNGIAA